MKMPRILLLCCLLLLHVSGAHAMTVSNSYMLYNDGTVADLSGSFGLGSLSKTYTTPGSYNVAALFDSEINALEPPYTGFTPELGSVHGTPGFSYELGDFSLLLGDFLNRSLTNSSTLQTGDLAVALGLTFDLLQGQQATVRFVVSDQAPGQGGYIEHQDAYYTDPDSGQYELLSDKIFYTASVDIKNTDNNPVPEPSTFALLGSALAGLGLYARRRRHS